MRHGTPLIGALARSLGMLEAVLGDEGLRSVAAVAADLGVPKATAHRQIATLIGEGYLRRLPTGGLVAGDRLRRLMQQADERQIVVTAAAPVLRRLANQTGCVAQLGTLDGDMVTYRFKTGRDAADLFTRVGMQLEAYCTGIGKVLLAALPEVELMAYLATGPFPALTAKTITDPTALREHLERVRASGFARDEEEMAEGVACIAVPVRTPEGAAVAAISVSRATSVPKFSEAKVISLARRAAREIEGCLVI